MTPDDAPSPADPALEEATVELRRLGRSTIGAGVCMLVVSVFLFALAALRASFIQGGSVSALPDWDKATVLRTEWFRLRASETALTVEPTRRRDEPVRYGSSTEFVQDAIGSRESRGSLTLVSAPLLLNRTVVGKSRRIALDVCDMTDHDKWSERANATMKATPQNSAAVEWLVTSADPQEVRRAVVAHYESTLPEVKQLEQPGPVQVTEDRLDHAALRRYRLRAHLPNALVGLAAVGSFLAGIMSLWLGVRARGTRCADRLSSDRLKLVALPEHSAAEMPTSPSSNPLR